MKRAASKSTARRREGVIELRKRKPAPEKTLQERVEELERQQRWWSRYIVLAGFLVVLGFWLINSRLDDILGITGGIIGNICGILDLIRRLRLG